VTGALTAQQKDLLVYHLREAYMEIFPAPGIAERLDVLERNAYVAVTCSPTKGVDETLDVTSTLVSRGFRVAPHIAARNVRDAGHLREILARLRELRIESIFVPGGDRPKPAGPYSTALELLREIAETGHDLKDIGVAAHPEGHPSVDDASLLDALRAKQPFATYLVTQMCFDAAALERWLRVIRSHGVSLPAWIGLPGAIDRGQLIKTSLRIGVGDSLRFLRKQVTAATTLMKSGEYTPGALVRELAPLMADADNGIAGYHLFCLNQVEKTESWRNAAIEALR